MTREQCNQGKDICFKLDLCDSVLKQLSVLENASISDLIIKGNFPTGENYDIF